MSAGVLMACSGQDALEADVLLANSPDLDTFGLNLACAWPLPDAMRSAYEALAGRLASIDTGLYVYPFPTTHVTAMTLVSFMDYPEPTEHQRARLRTLAQKVATMLDSFFEAAREDHIRPIVVRIERPYLARGAVILPMADILGEMARLRASVGAVLEGVSELRLKIPGIVHSTIGRFTRVPADPVRFRQRFAEVTQDVDFGTITFGEVLLTAETRPYMRRGDVIARFALRS